MSTITIHVTDSDGLYVGPRTIVRHPGQGLPAGAYVDAPPSELAPSGAARIQRQEDGWGLIEDHRGTIYWTADCGRVEITMLGETVPDNAAPGCPPPYAVAWSGADWVYDLEALRTAKQSEISTLADKSLADKYLAGLGAPYGAMERATWDQQYAEAQAYQADSQADAPLLTAIATARGMDVATLAARVIANRAAWVAISGAVVGQRLAYQDALDAATSADEINAIEVAYVAL